MRILSIIIALLSITGVIAQFDNFTINRLNATDFAKLDEQMATQYDSETGFAFATRPNFGNIGDSITVTKRGASTPTGFGSKVFNLGEYVVMCFTPRQDLYVRLLDTKPNGVTEQLYPTEVGKSVWVKGGIDYCMGNKNSDVLIYADEEAGVGKGILYLLGASSESDFPDIETITDTPPGWEHEGFEWATITAGNVEVQSHGAIMYEAYLNYEIKNPND